MKFSSQRVDEVFTVDEVKEDELSWLEKRDGARHEEEPQTSEVAGLVFVSMSNG